VPGVDQPDSIRPRRDGEAAGFAEVEEHGPGVVQMRLRGSAMLSSSVMVSR
jgi:hypothetical protein